MIWLLLLSTHTVLWLLGYVFECVRMIGGCSIITRLIFIGGLGGTPRKVRPMLAVKWLNIGHKRVHIRI